MDILSSAEFVRVPHLLFVLGYMLHFKKNKNPFVSFHWKFMRYVCTFKHGGGAVYHIIHLHFKKKKKKTKVLLTASNKNSPSAAG